MTTINQKCAPSKKYKDGSCISLDGLKAIAIKWNNKNKNKEQIIISNNKNNLVNAINDKLKNKCLNNQTCWLRLDVVKELENTNILDDILNNSFRPEGPNGKYEWLSTTDIDNVINQYHEKYSEFLFLGAVPYDFEDLEFLGIHNLNFKELEKKNINKIGMVINLDEHYKSGSHWVALYTDLDKYQTYYFDSVGKKPKKRIKKFINKILKYFYHKKFNSNISLNKTFYKLKKYSNLNNINKQQFLIDNSEINNLSYFDIRYNNIQHQFKDSECGVYSINFITRLIDGETFDNIINNVTTDEQMNAYRKQYFRN